MILLADVPFAFDRLLSGFNFKSFIFRKINV
jgi:hypothetical protein